MAGYGAKEARINREREARVTTCGDCGVEIDDTRILCEDCQHRDAITWEPVKQ